MGKLVIKWTRFDVSHKHDIDRDAPYAWLFGILIDLARVARYRTRSASPEKKTDEPYFVITRKATWPNLGFEKFGKGDWSNVPPGLDISEPTAHPMMVGVLVVMWEKALTSTATQRAAYDTAVATVDDFIAAQVDKVIDGLAEGKGLDLEVSAADTSALASLVKAAVTDVFKKHVNLIHDNYIGEEHAVFNIEPGHDLGQHLDFRFVQFATGIGGLITSETIATEYGLNGNIAYTP